MFAETVDWADSEDPQSWTVLPITKAEEAELVHRAEARMEASLRALGPGRRSLRANHPKASPQAIFWGTGLVIGPHD